MTGASTSLTVENTGEILLSAANGEGNGGCYYPGANGYSGGGGFGYSSTIAGGTAGGDGKDGRYPGGKGSGFNISSVYMKYYQLSAGKGGKPSGEKGGGGGGGILVDGFGPEEGDGVGEGYGGGGPGDSFSSDTSGSPGCLILEL